MFLNKVDTFIFIVHSNNLHHSEKKFTGEDLNMISHMHFQLIISDTVWQHYIAFNLLNGSLIRNSCLLEILHIYDNLNWEKKHQ